MPGWTIGVAGRGLAISVACIAVGGIALAQDMPPMAAPSASPATSAPNAAALPPAISLTPAPNAAAIPAATPAAPSAQLLTPAQLDQLVAPIALYPDPLLAQILMASTYPLEVVEAARWVGAPANRALKGNALTGALQAQNWDPSVKALVPFPRVLETMSNQLQWTEQLGNAFLAQQTEIMAAVQSLRRAAMAAGNLKETPQCRCVIQVSGETISILPAEPQVVCVPVYRPVAYGPWPYPAYPPYDFPIPVGFAYAPEFWIGFEPPVVLASFGPLWGWGSVDWGRHDIAVDTGRYALASGGRAAFSDGVWVHNPVHRGGVPYADAGSRARFNDARVSALTAATRSGGDAHFGAVRSGAALGRGGRFGAAEATHGGAAAFHGEAGFHGAPASHGGPASRGEAGFRNGAAAHGGTAPHGGAGFRGAPAAHSGPAFHGGPATAAHSGPAFHGGGPHGAGAPHFAMGSPHPSGGPHGGRPGGHHG